MNPQGYRTECAIEAAKAKAAAAVNGAATNGVVANGVANGNH